MNLAFNNYLYVFKTTVLLFACMFLMSSSTHTPNKFSNCSIYNETNMEHVMYNAPFKIIIDPGHGGHDPGCKGSHSVEKDISLEIALKVGKYILNSNASIEVIYTRKTDVFVPLHKRIDIANKNDADLFISIHCNSSSSKSVKGSESFVMGLHRSDDNLRVAKRENQVITLETGYDHNYGDYDPDSPVGHIILSMFQNIHLDQSIDIAKKIETNFTGQHNHKSRGVKQAGFVVLRNATMPSILIEAGFLTNAENEKYLLSQKGQSKTANAISEAIIHYVNTQKVRKSLVVNEPIAPVINIVNDVSTVELFEKPIQKPTEKLVQSEIKYTIQLAATTQKTIQTQKGKWASIENLKIKHTDQLYKYFSGSFSSREKANEEKLRLREMGFKGAFVVVLLI